MELNNENYFSKENAKKYLSVSRFKDFMKCEKEALAKINGELEEEKTDALLFGSYVDAYFSGELDQFTKEHSDDLFNKKTGEFKSAFKNVYDVIDSIKQDKMLMKYLGGEHQVVITGEIAGVPFKGKIDSYFKDKVIVDQKIIRSLEPVWVERDGRNIQTNFADAYGYIFQGAVYQFLESQQHERETGEKRKLPFVLAVTTKEENPDKALIQIDQEYLDEALKKVEELAPRYWGIMQGLIEPTGCGKCSVCRKLKTVTGVQSYKKLFHLEEEIEY